MFNDLRALSFRLIWDSPQHHHLAEARHVSASAQATASGTQNEHMGNIERWRHGKLVACDDDCYENVSGSRH